MVALAVVVRLVSEVPNFGAVTAAALFAGFYFRDRLTAIYVPLAIMAISDQFLGGYDKRVMLAVYGVLLVPFAWRPLLRAHLTPARIALAAVTSSIAFYAVTNGAVWYAWYPHDASGFVRCYAVAMPFFRHTLASDAIFSAMFFGAYSLVAARLRCWYRLSANWIEIALLRNAPKGRLARRPASPNRPSLGVLTGGLRDLRLAP